MSHGPYVTVRKRIARKPLRLFTEVLDVKNKGTVCQAGHSKYEFKSIRAVSVLWSIILKRRGHTKTNEQVKKYLYNWILFHTHAVQSPITNDFLKFPIDGHSELWLALKTVTANVCPGTT